MSDYQGVLSDNNERGGTVRILHTADWHMQDRLGRQDRSEHISHALEQIAGYLEEYRVDMMLVAGDIFSEHCRAEQLREAVASIKRIFQPFIQRGGTIVAISGNHDSEVFFETLRDALDLVAEGTPGSPAHAAGRLHVAAHPGLLRLAGRDGTIVQFVLMPFPTARGYLNGERGERRYATPEDKYQAIAQGYKETLHTFQGQLDVHLPSVLVSHIHVRGAETYTHHSLGDEDSILVEQDDLPADFAYVACGHIHKAQTIKRAPHMRYCGSIERMDVAEGQDTKSVVLCEVGPRGLVGEPLLLPLRSTPIYHVEITDPETQIPQLLACYPDAQNALVKYTLHWDPEKHIREELARRVEGIFPRWYERNFKEIGQNGNQKTVFAQQRLLDVVGTVRDYLNMNLVGDPHRDELLALANELLAEEAWL
jgi:DNA repair protein SbcD/Mre11